MSKKDTKDPHAVIVIRRLLQIIDLGMIEDLQQAEESRNVARNLEIAESLDTKKGKNFFSRSTDKINKILHKSGMCTAAMVLERTTSNQRALHAQWVKSNIAQSTFVYNVQKKRYNTIRYFFCFCFVLWKPLCLNCY